MIIGADRLPELLDQQLADDELVRLSFASYVRIEHDGHYALLQNKGALAKQGKVIFSPIGGGVAIPAVQMGEVEALCEDPPAVWDRQIVGGAIDVRVWMGRSAMPGVLEWLTRLPVQASSPVRELHEELVEEERMFDHSEIARVALKPLGYYTELKHWRLAHKVSTTLHVAHIWDARMPGNLLWELRYGNDERVVWANEAMIQTGIVDQTIGSNALALFAWQEHLTIPHDVSQFTEV